MKAKPARSDAKARKADRGSASQRRGKLAATSIAVIVLLSFVGYGHLLQPGKTLYSPHSDFVAYGLTAWTVLYDSLHQGRGIPFWRDDQLSGCAGLTSPLSQYTNPTVFPFYVLPPAEAVGWTYWLMFLIAGVTMWLAGAALELGFWPRLLMAAAGMFMFKLIIATYAGWMLWMIVWAPALFAAVVHLVRRPGLLAALGLAAVGGLCLHSGHLQLFYYTFLFLLAYLFIQAVRLACGRQWAMLARSAGWLALGAVLAVGMAVYLLLPLASDAPLMARSQSNYRAFAIHTLVPQNLAMFVYPEAFGTPRKADYQRGDELWEDETYFGLVPLALAVAGTVLGWRRPLTKYLAGCFVVSLLLTVNSDLLRFLYDYLPGFKLFRSPGRFLFLTAFFGIALAGVGLESLLARMERKALLAQAGAAVSAILIAIIVAEGVYYSRAYLTMVPTNLVVPAPDYRRYLAADRGVFRVAPSERWSIQSGWAAPMGLHLVTGYEPTGYRYYGEYFDLLQANQLGPPRPRVWYDLLATRGPGGAHQMLLARPDLLDALNVKYVVSPYRLLWPDDHFLEAATFPRQPIFFFYRGLGVCDLHLYRNTRFLERAFWAPRVVTVRSEEQGIGVIEQNNLHDVAVVQTAGAPPAVEGAIGPPAGDEPVTVLAAWGGHLALEARASRERFLVVSEVWHPSWRAKIDGRPATVYRTNHAMLGLAVPPGNHHIVFDFQPVHWWTGVTVSLCAGGAFAILLVWGLARRYSSKATRGGEVPVASQ